ncbi:MAG: MFS transporter [Parahaliea sp.]
MAHSIPAMEAGDASHVNVTRRYAWVVFALTFGLLISDYMSRQVLNAVFPLIKDEWMLTDQQLGLLSGIVALMVGLLTFPLSLIADRWGRIRSLTLMAVLWSLSTLGCALAQSYEQMFVARFLVGVGEAAYGSVGIAVVLSVFPVRLRATLASAFMAGGMFGSVLGVGFGGVIAEYFGWRWAFSVMAVFGLTLAIFYPFVVSEKKIGSPRTGAGAQKGMLDTHPLRTLFNTRSVLCAYIGSGFQLFVAGTLMVWVPSYLNRYYGMATDKAGLFAAFILVCSGVGTILCGMLSDYLARHSPARKVSLAVAYALTSCALLSLAFALPHGAVQIVFLVLGMMVVSGTNGPSTAMVANLTNYTIHSTAFATLTLANNLLGLAPGPLLTGRISDIIGLQNALQLVPLMSLAAAGVFLLARWTYLRDVSRIGNPA